MSTDPIVTPTETTNSTGEQHHISSEALAISFLIGGLFLGGILREVKKKTGIPYTPLLFTAGILLGLQSHYYGIFGGMIENISKIDPREMLFMFLPTLVFSVGYNIDWHKFKKQILQILILSGPCVLIGSILIAISLKVVLGYSDSYYSWAGAFMFGAILSCTDTGTIVSLLKENGGSKKFISLIEGESLINDGTCMVLLILASQVVLGQTYTIFSLTTDFLELTIGGIVLGIVVGIVCVYWIRMIFNDDVMVVNVTFVACYLIYFFAEKNTILGFNVSGIVALISFGLFMAAFGKSRINSESVHSVQTIWNFVTFCAETIVFLMAGIIIGFRVILRKYNDDSLPVLPVDIPKLIILYICMMLARYIGILIFMPILKRHGYGLTKEEAFFLSYGGLRGAIGICFALIVGRNPSYDPTFRHFILFDMAGCSLLTILINGPTLGFLIRRKDFNIDIIKQKVFLSNIEAFVKKIKKYKKEISIQEHLTEVDWSKLDSYIGIPEYEKLMRKTLHKINEMEREQKRVEDTSLELNPLKIFVDKGLPDTGQELLEKDGEGNYVLLSDKEDDSNEYEDDLEERLITEARNRFIKALRGEYHKLFTKNQISPSAYLILKESVNWDLDNVSDPMSSWDFVSNHFTNPTTIRVLFFLKRIPLFGNLARKNLFNHIFFVYDVVLNYLNAHDSCERIAETFPFSDDIISSIQEESEENKNMAEAYLKNFLNISFPEINKDIQVKKASTSVLNYQKSKITSSYTQGQLEEKEYKQIKESIDEAIFNLTENYGSWDLPPLKEFMKKIPLFTYFNEADIEDLLSDAVERPFQKDEFIIKEGEKAKYIYVVTRGNATESCKSSSNLFKDKMEVTSVVSYHQIVSGFRRYETSCIADSLVYAVRLNLNKIRKIAKRNNKLNEFLWKESFFFLTRFYDEELSMLSNVDERLLNQIVNFFNFKKYKPHSRIDFSKGGIFLKGQAKEKGEDSESDPNSEEEKPYQAIIYQSLTYIPPSKSKFLITEKYSWVFHFTNVERITDLINKGIAEKERSRSRSFLGYQKQQDVHPKIVKHLPPKIEGNIKGDPYADEMYLLPPLLKFEKSDSISHSDTQSQSAPSKDKDKNI